MPNYVSVLGTLVPKKERVALRNNGNQAFVYNGKKIEPGEDFIYEGPDRAALIELHEKKVESLGGDYRLNIDFLTNVRNLGFSSPDEYLKFLGLDEAEMRKKAEEEASKVTLHELPKRVKAIEQMGGGDDMATGKILYKGGFGEPPTV